MEAGEHGGALQDGVDVVAMLRAQVHEVHRELDEALSEWLRGLEPIPLPKSSTVVALYLHAATVEDVTIQSILRGVAPMYKTHWGGDGPAHYSTADLTLVRAYAQHVFAATDSYLAELSAEEAGGAVDLTRLGLGQLTVAWIISKFVVLQLAQIYGELKSALQRT